MSTSTKWIPTADDWHGNYLIDAQGNESMSGTPMVKAKVMMHLPRKIPKWVKRKDMHEYTHWFVRICFWGNDDLGIEQDAYLPTQELAIHQYNQWIKYVSNLSIASRENLLQLGFHYA